MDENFLKDWALVRNKFWDIFPEGHIYLNEIDHVIAVDTGTEKLLINYIHAGCEIIAYNNDWVVGNELTQILKDLGTFKADNYPDFETYVIIDFALQDLGKMFLDKLPKDVAYWKISNDAIVPQNI